MQPSILAIDASSPEDFEQKLREKKGTTDARFLALAISDRQVLARAFNLELLSTKEVAQRLSTEAVELLSLPFSNIVFDHVLLHSDLERSTGIYACAPKKLLARYFEIIDRERFIALRVTPYMIAKLDAFFKEHSAPGARFALLDFYNVGMMSLAVFNKNSCELIREIPFENPDEAIREIIQSLRSCCAQSKAKDFQNIFISGNFAKKDELVSQLRSAYQTNIKEDPAGAIARAIIGPERLDMNLAKTCRLDQRERKLGLNILHGVLGVLAVLVLISAGKFWLALQEAGKVSSSFEPAKYEYAQELQSKLNN